MVGKTSDILPVRCFRKFENDGYVYTFKPEGTIENFIGVEEIFKEDKLIYRLECHGEYIE